MNYFMNYFILNKLISLNKPTIYFYDLNQVQYTNYHCGNIISNKNGGTDNITNLKVLCPLCNMSMSSTDLEEFYFVNIILHNLF
jgi:hypothetical protein